MIWGLREGGLECSTRTTWPGTFTSVLTCFSKSLWRGRACCLVQHHHIPVAVHRRLGRQEEDWSLAALAAEAGPPPPPRSWSVQRWPPWISACSGLRRTVYGPSGPWDWWWRRSIRWRTSVSQSFTIQDLNFLQKASLFFTILLVKRGFFSAHRDSSPSLLLHMS